MVTVAAVINLIKVVVVIAFVVVVAAIVVVVVIVVVDVVGHLSIISISVDVISVQLAAAAPDHVAVAGLVKLFKKTLT